MAEYYGDIECYRKEKGMYKPNFNTDNAILGIFKKKGNKKPYIFNLEKEPESMFNFILSEIEAEGKRGHFATFYFFNSNYDWTAIARNHYYDKNIKYICYRPFIVEIKTENGTGVIRDATDLYPKMKLERVGEIIGMAKKDMPKEVFSIRELIPYCLRDCEILEQSLKKLKEAVNEIFDYKPTKLVSVYKLGYDLLQQQTRKEEYIKENGKKVSKYGYWWFSGKIHKTCNPRLTIQASRGGRIEAYKWSTPTNRKIFKDIWKVDNNSMYPYVCCTRRFPDVRAERQLKEHELAIETLDLKEVDDFFSHLGISRVTIKAPDMYLPYLSIRHRGSSIYPKKAILEGAWTNFEIREAVIKYGYKLLEIHESLRYKDMPFSMFKTYFNKLYEIKKNNTGEMKEIAKILANSSTGRFAMKLKIQDEQVIKLQDLSKWQMKGYEGIVTLDNGLVIIRKQLERLHLSNKSNPSIYAHITAYARDELYKKLIKIPEEDLLYATTDAIIFKDKENLKHFKIGTEMGEWKVEEKGDTAEIWNEQFYEIAGNVRGSEIRKEDMNIEAIRTGNKLSTKRLFTVKMGFKTGRFDLVGKFLDHPISMQYTPKRARKYPEYILEARPSENTSYRKEEETIYNG